MDLDRLYTNALKEFFNSSRVEGYQQPKVRSAETKMLTIMLLEHKGYKCADMRRAMEANLIKAYEKADLGLPLVFKFFDDASAALHKECSTSSKDTSAAKPDMDGIVELAWSSFCTSMKARKIADIPADRFDALIHPMAQVFFQDTGDDCKFLERESTHDLRMLYLEHISKDKGTDIQTFKIAMQVLYKDIYQAQFLEKGMRGQIPGRN